MSQNTSIKSKPIIVVRALSKANTYYLFREDNQEVEITIKGVNIYSTPSITEEEKEFIKAKYIL